MIDDGEDDKLTNIYKHKHTQQDLIYEEENNDLEQKSSKFSNSSRKQLRKVTITETNQQSNNDNDDEEIVTTLLKVIADNPERKRPRSIISQRKLSYANSPRVRLKTAHATQANGRKSIGKRNSSLPILPPKSSFSQAIKPIKLKMPKLKFTDYYKNDNQPSSLIDKLFQKFKLNKQKKLYLKHKSALKSRRSLCSTSRSGYD